MVGPAPTLAAELLAKVGFPCVVFNQPESPTGVGSVTSDDASAINEAVQHLVDLGHRRIGYQASEVQNHSTMRSRFEAFKLAMVQAGLPLTENDVFHGRLAHHDGKRAAEHWLRAGAKRPTAVICDHYAAAMHVAARFREAQLRIGEDISLIGFDDLHDLAPLDPPLTVLTPPLRQMADDAVRFLVQIIGGTDPNDCQKLHQTKLIIKQSTGPPGAQD